MVATTPMASRRMLDVWSTEYSAVALPSRWRAAPAKKSMLSTLPGTSNSVASRTGLPVWLTSSATSSSACSPASLASLASTADRSAGVAVAHPGNAVRAAATAASTSAVVARAYSATTPPFAGLTILKSWPAVATAPPLIQLLALVMTQTVADPGCALLRYPWSQTRDFIEIVA